VVDLITILAKCLCVDEIIVEGVTSAFSGNYI
jgi:hypothetical protein